jgi:protein-tyrosine phosphatase
MDDEEEYSLINKISEKIFLGDEDAAADLGILKEFKITHILICAKEPKKYFENEFVYKQFHIEDFPEQNIVQYFKEAFSFIDSAKIIFIHCQAGVSRSASFVIGYLMWKLKKSFEEIFAHVKDKRKIIDPNEGFVKQLNLFNKYLIENGYKVKLNSLKNQLKLF